MFDYFAEGLQAYNQVGLFVGALVCLGIGGLILGSSLYWRLHAPRVSGTIVGVISHGDMYTPVYRYTSPDGQTHEAKSDISSSSMYGKETGRAVALMISPHDPAKVQEVNGYLFDAVGFLLFGSGAFLGYIAITAYPVTWMTWLMAGLVLAYLAERGWRTVIPKGQRPSFAEWRSRRATVAIDPSEITSIEKLLASPEAQAKVQAQPRSNRKGAPLVALFAAILLVAGLYEARNIARLEASGLRAQGEVVRLKRDSDSSRDSTYHAVVRFQTKNGVTVEFEDKVGSNPPSHRRGDRVVVLYNADDPRGDAIIDRGSFWNWAIPGLLLLGALLLGWLFAWMIKGRRPGDETTASRVAAAR